MRFFMIGWKQSLRQWLHWGLLTCDEMRWLKRLILFSISLNLDCRSLEKRHLIRHSTQAVRCLQGSTRTVRFPFEPFYGQARLHKVWIPFQQITGWRPASWKRINQSLLQITSKRLLRASERSEIRLPHTRYSPYCVPWNIWNAPYEMDNQISKEVQGVSNICYPEEFSRLSRLFCIEQREESDFSVDRKRAAKSS